MKKYICFCFVAIVTITVTFFSCKKTNNETTPVIKEFFNGYVQKGPFVNGSSVSIVELNESFNQTGKTYQTAIIDNSGSFELNNIELASRYVELKGDGFYFNEITGETSGAPLTLSALADVENVNSVNVNILTHLEKQRVEYLIKQQRMSYTAAKKQAQNEILAIFGFQPQENSSETLNLANNAALLAISCIMQGHLSTGDMVQLTADIIADMKQDGKLDNVELGAKLMNNAISLKSLLSTIRNNLSKKFTELGINVTIPDFESYIQSFIDNGLYPSSISIKYPKTGEHGINILSDEVTEIVIKDYEFIGSMRAETPKGFSLKVILKDAEWFYQALPTPKNWSISTYDDNTKSQVFTVTESGKVSDLNFMVINKGEEYEFITIEYYENGATTPTKVKKLNIILED